MSSVPAYAAGNQHFVTQNEQSDAKEDDGKIVYFWTFIYILVDLFGQTLKQLINEWSFQRCHLLRYNGVISAAWLFILHEEFSLEKQVRTDVPCDK